MSPQKPPPPLHVRLDVPTRDALVKAHRAMNAGLMPASMHRVALAALRLGAERIAADPSSVLGPVGATEPAAAEAPPPSLVRGVPTVAREQVKPSKPSPKAPSRPKSATRQGGEGDRTKASPSELDAASVAIRRARAAGHGTAALIHAAQVKSTGGARETLRDLAADPRPDRTFTRALTLSLTAGALRLAPPP